MLLQKSSEMITFVSLTGNYVAVAFTQRISLTPCYIPTISAAYIPCNGRHGGRIAKSDRQRDAAGRAECACALFGQFNDIR